MRLQRGTKAAFASAAVSKEVAVIAWRPVPVLAGYNRIQPRKTTVE